MRARYYDTKSGRFTNRDRFEGLTTHPVSLHKYLYANSNPANNIDPSGNSTLLETVAIAVLIGILSDLVIPYALQTPTNSGDIAKQPILQKALFEVALGSILAGAAAIPRNLGITAGEDGLWNFWRYLPKTTVSGRTYAVLRDRLFTQHIIDRMTPSGFGVAAGAGGAAGRSVPFFVIDDVLTNGVITETRYVDGALRAARSLGDVTVVTEVVGPTEQEVVITVITR